MLVLHRVYPPLLALLAACSLPWELYPACDDGTGCSPTSTSSGGADATTASTVPTGDVQTVTGGSSEPSSTGADAPANDLPPVGPALKAEPDELEKAGTIDLELSDVPVDVVTVQLKLNGNVIADLTPDDFPYTWEAFSEKDNGAPHTFEARLKTEKGLSETVDAKVWVNLPPAGSVMCSFPALVDMATEPAGIFSSILYTDDALIVGGWRDVDGKTLMVVHKLDPDHCTPQPGWPRTLADWTGNPDLTSKTSVVVALAVDEHGNIVVGANLLEGSLPQRYTVMLTPDGAAIPNTEIVGLAGEAVSGVAITPEPEPILVAVGWWTVSENPPSTDLRWWRIHPDGSVDPPLGAPAPWTEDEQPDLLNERSERARAAVIHPDTGILYVVGDRDFLGDDFFLYTRSWVARVDPFTGAGLSVPWTSSGDVYSNDALTSISLCGNRFLGAGWTQKWPLNTTQPYTLTRWVELDGSSTHRVAEIATASQGFGAACDREGKVVAAGTRTTTDLDADVFAFVDAEGPRVPYHAHLAGKDAAFGMACDARGFCAWPGYRTIEGQLVAVVQVHHP